MTDRPMRTAAACAAHIKFCVPSPAVASELRLLAEALLGDAQDRHDDDARAR